MNKFIALALLAFSITASAVEVPPTWYYQVDRNVKVVIEPLTTCTLMEGEGEKLFSAYALNTDTGDRVDGCFSFRKAKESGKVIAHIELQGKDVTPEGQPYIKHYTYDYPIDKFQPSETM